MHNLFGPVPHDLLHLQTAADAEQSEEGERRSLSYRELSYEVTRLAEAVSLDALSVADWDLDVTDERARAHDDDLDDDEDAEIDADLDAALSALDAADEIDDETDDETYEDDDLIDAHAEETV